jgi:hypothetical protein
MDPVKLRQPQAVVLWIVMPCIGDVGYQCFGGLCCIHLQGEVSVTPYNDDLGYLRFGRPCCLHLQDGLKSRNLKSSYTLLQNLHKLALMTAA